MMKAICGMATLARNNAMDCNACSTKILLHWMKDCCNRTQVKGKASLLLERFRFLIFKFVMQFTIPGEGFLLQLDDQTSVSINSALLIGNLKQMVASKHRQLEKAWGLQWQSMQAQLQMDWNSGGLPLQTVLEFALTAIRTRREQGKPAWKGENLKILEKLQISLLTFVAEVAEMTVNQDRSQFVDKAVPPRRYSRCGVFLFGPTIVNHDMTGHMNSLFFCCQQ